MGLRGAVPNRTEDLSRERDANRNGRPPVTKGELRPVTIPPPDPDWHPIARMMWDAAQSSGMVDFYQDTDFAFLYSIVDDLSRNKETAARGGRVNSQLVTAVYSAMSSLGFTEGDRRRMRIELENKTEEGPDAAVTAINDYKATLGLVK